MIRTALAVGLIVFGAGLAVVRGVLGGGPDEEVVFVTTASLVRDRDLAFDAGELAEIAEHTTIWTDAVRRSRNGRWEAVYGPGQAIAAIPFYLLGRLAGERPTIVRWVCGLNPLVTGLTAALLCAWLLALGLPQRVAVTGGLLYGLATMAWPYSKTFLSEPLSALCYLVAAAATWRAARDGDIRWAFGAGASLAYGILVRPHNIVIVPVLATWLALVSRGRGRAGGTSILALAVPVLAVVGWWLWYNQQRYGRVLDFGYLSDVQSDFSVANLPIGIFGQLLSPGRGLLWYAPPVALAFWGWRSLTARDPGAAWLALSVAGWQLVFYSLRSTWWGNWCWGPRYLVPVLPLLMLLAAPALERREVVVRSAAVVAALAGLAGAAAGLVVYNGLYQDWVYGLDRGLAKMLWSPIYSPLVGHWRFARDHVDLLLWQAGLKLGWGFALTALLIRLSPALAGLLLLRQRGGADGR